MRRMKRVCLEAVVVMVLAINLAFSYGDDIQPTELRQDNGVNEWADRNYAAVLEVLLPTGVIAPEKFPKGAKWITTVRIIPPYQKLEYHFSMTKMYGGKVELLVTTAKGKSIISQLQELRIKHPDASVEKLTGLIAIEKSIITHNNCSRISLLADQFEKINISPVLPDELGVDETGYELWTQSQWGNRINLVLGGPGPAAKKQPHPLPRWVEAVRSAIQKCKGR